MHVVTNRSDAALDFKQGDLVLVQPHGRPDCDDSTDWWLGWVIRNDAADSDASRPPLVQVSDCETGQAQWVSTSLCKRVVLPCFNNVVSLF